MHNLLDLDPNLVPEFLKDWDKQEIIYNPGEPDDQGEIILYYNTPDGQKIPMLAKTELLVITGPQKSRKTLLLQCALMSRHSNDANKTFGFEMKLDQPVLLFDTEQPMRRTRKNIRRYHEVANLLIADPYYRVFNIKKYTSGQKLDFISHAIHQIQDETGVDPGLILIDQVADLCPARDVNNDAGVDMVLTHLNLWGAETNAALGVVVHTNRGRLQTNGKLGVMLDQKTDCTLHVDIDFDTWISTVTHKESRDNRIPKFTFRQDFNGHPRLLVVDDTNKNHI